MEAVRTSETSVNFYETTRRSIPEDSHFHVISLSVAPVSSQSEGHYLLRVTALVNAAKISNMYLPNVRWTHYCTFVALNTDSAVQSSAKYDNE
jgi:hypothetical protein